MSRSLTPAGLRKRWGCSHSHVLSLIRSGQLQAINIATSPQKARWSIPLEAVEQFEKARIAVKVPAAKPSRKRQRRRDVIEFFS